MQRRVLITGGARRIGRAIAETLAARGMQVIVHYRDSEREAEELVAALPGDGHSAVRCDLTDMEAVSALIPRLCKEGRAPDALVNNASSYTRIRLAQSTPDTADAAMRVNFLAPFELMRQFRASVGHGVIVNLTDQRNCHPDPASGLYAIAKKALQHATEAAALEWAPDIRVNAVAPGLVLPPPGKSEEGMKPLLAKIPMQRRTTETQVAEAILFLMENDAMTGQTLYADGGLHLLGTPIETDRR